MNKRVITYEVMKSSLVYRAIAIAT